MGHENLYQASMDEAHELRFQPFPTPPPCPTARWKWLSCESQRSRMEVAKSPQRAVLLSADAVVPQALHLRLPTRSEAPELPAVRCRACQTTTILHDPRHPNL